MMNRSLLHAAAFAVTLATGFFGAAGMIGALAQTVATPVVSDKKPILLRADQVTQDQDLGIVVARGNVEIARGNEFILADTLSYNRNAKTVTASGNVRILEPSGEVIFADYIELSEDLREGTIENLKILLDRYTRIAAAGGRRIDGNRTDMAKAVYSPCEVCADNPEEDPLWQVKAERVIHDQKDQQIEYYNAVMEVYGVPVMYLPYFTHPDPTVKRKSGFLIPSYGSKTNTGQYVRTPYFWAISDSQDITFDPILTTKVGMIFSASHRLALDSGYIETSGSLARADREVGTVNNYQIEQDKIRGHIFTGGKFDIDDTWRWGWDINRVSDKTYLQKFGFWEDPGNSALSRGYAEGFRGRNYLSAEAMNFQNLRPGTYSKTPRILPSLNYNGVGEPDRYGGHWVLDSNFRGFFDGDDSDSQRASAEAAYVREFVSQWGLLTTVTGSLRADVYNIDHVRQTDRFGNQVDDGVAARLIPRVSAEMRYPFVRYSETGRQVIEPIVALHAAPNGGNPVDIPNSDSSVFETDDTNILDANRLAGLDRVETGQKAVAGLKLANYWDNGGKVTAFLGNSYRFSPDQELKRELLLENRRSDWVGRIGVQPNQYIDAYSRFSFPTTELAAKRSEVGANFGGRGLRFGGIYTFVRDNADPSAIAIDQLQLSVDFGINDFWSTRLSTVQDLKPDGGSLSHTLNLAYDDECYRFDAQFSRAYTRSVDVRQEDTILLKMTFKTLGEVTF